MSGARKIGYQALKQTLKTRIELRRPAALYVNLRVRRRSLAPNRYAALHALSARGFGK